MLARLVSCHTIMMCQHFYYYAFHVSVFVGGGATFFPRFGDNGTAASVSILAARYRSLDLSEQTADNNIVTKSLAGRYKTNHNV